VHQIKEQAPVIHEKIFPYEREEIQPVIHRDREQTEVIQVEAPTYEREIRPMTILEKQLPAEMMPEMRESTKESDLIYEEFAKLHHSTLERAPMQHNVIQKPPIVEEHIKKTVIEEIQPIIHKEVLEPHLIRETKPIYEKVVEAPTITRVVRELEGFHLEDHNNHHQHHGLVLSGKLDCKDCKIFHQYPEACEMCSPRHRYEGCHECDKFTKTSFLPLFPGLALLEDHNKHHYHHSEFLSGKGICFDCQRLHNKELCSLCQPGYYYEGCSECSKLKQTGKILPAYPGLDTHHRVLLQQRESFVQPGLKQPEKTQIFVTQTRSEFSQAKQQM